MSYNTLGSLSTLDSGHESFRHSRTASQNSDAGSMGCLGHAKRKMLDDKGIVVTEEFMAKTQVKIDNLEHAKVHNNTDCPKLTVHLAPCGYSQKTSF